MFNRAQMRFLRGLAAATIPVTLDYLISYLGGQPLFGLWTPLVVAALLALDKVVRDLAHEREETE